MSFVSFLLQPKFVVMMLIGVAVIILLKSKTMKKGIKVGLLLLSTFLFGIAGNIPAEIFSSFAMHPSPICAVDKAMLYGFGVPLIVTLFVIFLLTLIGPKLFCGYVCPVGAPQELVAMLSDKLGIKRKTFSFRLAQLPRILLFIVFIFISVTGILTFVVEGEVYAKSIYDFINPFHGLEFFKENSILDYVIRFVPFILVIILSFKYYRPFCHFICPIGLFTQVLEQVGLARVRLDKKACTDCGVCLEKAPCTAIPEILKDSNLRPDCFACNACIEACPVNALGIGVKRTIGQPTSAQ